MKMMVMITLTVTKLKKREEINNGNEKLKHRVEELENLMKMVVVGCKDINQTAISALENKEERLGLTDCKNKTQFILDNIVNHL